MERFKQGLKLTSEPSLKLKSVVAKIPEVKQTADENFNNYFNRANKILWELKSNIDPTALTIPEIMTLFQKELLDSSLNKEETHSHGSRAKIGDHNW